MARIIYNKLVRDLIPEVIEIAGKTAVTEILDDEQYRISLDLKLAEEMDEYQRSKEVEELADILEVIYAIVETKGMTINDLELLRKEKADKRGAFRDKIFLKEVLDDSKR
jgi:predicted house-cleaning noncanonical NTP pyrophosphatase (MazG superfamily)